MNIQQVKDVIRSAAIAHGAQKAILFGSYARGTVTRHSDIDAIFVENTAMRYLDRLGKYMDYLWDMLHVPSDVFVYTPEEWGGMAWKPFIKQVLLEGIIVYEQRKTA